MTTDDLNAMVEREIERHPQYPTDVRERLKVLAEPMNKILLKQSSDTEAVCWETKREDIRELITQSLRFLEALDRDEEFIAQGVQEQEKTETEIID